MIFLGQQHDLIADPFRVPDMAFFAGFIMKG